MRSGRVSVRDLAEELRLNASTVSRALNGHPSIHADTVRRVQALAARRGYRASPEVRRAMTTVRQAQTDAVAGILGLVLFQEPHSQEEKNALQSPIVAGMRERAREIGWMIDVIRPRESGMNPRRVRSILQARHIEGILLPPPPFTVGAGDFDFTDLYAVAATGADFGRVLPRVLPSHWNNAKMLFEYLREHGYRRPLLLIHENIEKRHAHATVGAYTLTRELGWWERKLPLHIGALNPEKICPLFTKHNPDVVVGPDVFVHEFLTKDLKLSVPKDIAFVCYSTAKKGFAGIDQRWEDIGAASVDMVTAMLYHRTDHASDGERDLRIHGKLTPGPTLPVPAPRRPA